MGCHFLLCCSPWGCIELETFLYLDYDVSLIKTEFPVLFPQVPQKSMLWTYHKFFFEFCDDFPLIFFRLSTTFSLIEILPLLPHLTKFILSDCLYIVSETCQDCPKAYISLIDKFGHKPKCCGPLSLIIKTCSLSYPNFPN